MTKDQVFGKKIRPSEVSVNEGSKFVGAVFLYVFAALAITAVVAGIAGSILRYGFGIDAVTDTYVTVLMIALILYIPTVIWIQISALRSGKTLGPAFIFYSVIMGFLMSTFVAFIDFYTIALSFGVTCLAFGSMALIAWKTKKNLSPLAIIGLGLLLGAIMMSLVNTIITLITGFDSLTWIVSFAVLVAIVLITMVDLQNVKRIGESGYGQKNVALLCAFNLYVDFIYIFIRVLGLIARLRSK